MKNLLILTILAVLSLQVNSSEPLFSTALYKAIGENKNLVFSPYSIRSCLGLAYMVAGGKTAAELTEGLRFGAMTKEEVANSFASDLQGNGTDNLVNIANKIFINKNYEVSRNFSKLSRQSFDSDVEYLDFARSSAAEATINNWVEKETNGKIKNLLSPGTVDRETSALLVNTIHFKGEWVSPFPHSNTEKKDFYSTPGKAIPVDFMYDNDQFSWAAVEDLDATAVELNYKNGDLSMVIVLPNKQDGLGKMAEKVQNNYDLMSISKKMDKQQVSISIPKFEMAYELDLKSPLAKMGIKTMFTDEADFHDLFSESTSPVKISKVFHKAVIKIDEAGTEADASTYMKWYFMMLPISFCADHPFLWYIKDKKNIYFMGQLTKF